MSISEDPLYIEVHEALIDFRTRYLERVEKEQQRLEAYKINSDKQSKWEQELKLNKELEARLTELTKRTDDLDKICSNFASGVTIVDRDQQRLDQAKLMYQISKELTGIRFHHSAPADTVTGYIKSETRKTLTPFELDASSDVSEALWNMLDVSKEKENVTPN